MDIMLIDDDEDCVLSLAGAIEPMGHYYEMFTVPEKAVESFRKKPADVVITDMEMPSMSGIDVLKEVKNLNPETKVILVTGYSDSESTDVALKNGASAYFSKPIDVFQIIELLEEINMDIEERKHHF